MHKNFVSALLPGEKNSKWESDIIHAANTYLQVDLFSTENAFLEQCPLSFYPGCCLIKLNHFSSMPPLSIYFIMDQKNELYALTGSRECFEIVNEKVELLLNMDTLIPYCKFYLGAVEAEEGPFFLIENLGDFDFTEQAEPFHLTAIRKHLAPPLVKPVDNGFKVHTFINYGVYLFEADLSVSCNGNIEIESEKVAAEFLPTKVFRME